MTFASDQKSDPEGLSETSRRMLALRDDVLAEWEARVRANLAPGTALARPLLIDSLPSFYDNIVEALSPGYPRANAVDGTTLAAEHGRERARLTDYDHQALIGEYQKLRWVIFSVMHRAGVVLSPSEVQTINSSIDAGIKDAMSGFVLANRAAREGFAAALAHDLRGPLAAAVTALDLIVHANDLAQVRTWAHKAHQQLGRMDGMLRELLDTMAFHSGAALALHLTHFDVLGLAREVMAARPAPAARPVRLIGVPVQGWWDRAAMTRALENLLSNADKYGTPGSDITIKASTTHGRLQLSVHNLGAPIPAAHRESVFAMYQRTAAAAASLETGWGIGLPYVRAVAESHSGQVILDSDAARGTTFTIDVPVDCRPHVGAPATD